MLVENDEQHERQHKKKRFNSLQESETVKAYCRYFAKFVVMLLKLAWRNDSVSLQMKKYGSADLWRQVCQIRLSLSTF